VRALLRPGTGALRAFRLPFASGQTYNVRGMNPHLQRAELLIGQSRYDLAEEELRQALALDPRDAFAHGLLALCLGKRERFAEATTEAQQSIHLAPDFPFAHYTLASILHDRRRNDEALAAITEALRLDSSEADYFALLSVIHLDERRWPAALEAAERGLRQDSEHVGCTNLRAIAMVKLGRKAEAGATIDAALARNPDNAITHANQGWTLLEKGDSKKALEHFREALRLDPDNAWARQGIIEALKARHFIYALMLRYFFFMSKLSRRAQWGVIAGGYFGSRLLGGISQARPEFRPWILPLQIAYIAFALLTWVADPLFNLMLRLNRFGRLALTREKTIASNWIGASLLLALLSLAGCFAYGFNSPWLLGALVFGLLLIPLAGTFRCSRGWPRTSMALYTGGMAGAGIAAILMFALGPKGIGEDLGTILLGLFVLGAIGSGWIANILIMQRRRR
jgi:tetratricopeptide (TPR) repeat protein